MKRDLETLKRKGKERSMMKLVGISAHPKSQVGDLHHRPGYMITSASFVIR